MPAMLAVLSDPRLFASLLRCLKLPLPDSESDAVSSSPATRNRTLPNPNNHNPRTNQAGRKRSMSFSNNDSNSKLAKSCPTSSPMQSKGLSNNRKNGETMSLPIHLIAASIFYVSLQHLDHWPAPLLHAYAEDTFGPRMWVDRPECQLLVSNLKLVHDKNIFAETTKIDDPNLIESAGKVANYYMTMMQNIPEEVSLPHTKPDVVMRTISQSSVVDPAFPDDSDSGEEEIVEVSMGKVEMKSTSSKAGDDSSSSGEEEVIAMENTTTERNNVINQDPFPVQPREINLKRIRPRYFGLNREQGFLEISTALAERLEVKSKQNSKLLQTLPNFCIVPGVRALAARNLERWLQSPALSGAARVLFSSTVNFFEDCDPPLSDDLEAIDAILSMHLKANQLNMHIENVTQIAKGVSTVAVARHIYTKLLCEEIKATDDSQAATNLTSQYLQMVSAVHGVFARTLSNDGLAAAVLALLTTADKETSQQQTRKERNQLVWKIRLLLRRLLGELGTKFDRCGLVESLLTFNTSSESWTLFDEEDKGRIILECVALNAPNPREDTGIIRGKNMKKFLQAVDTATNELSSEEVTKLKSVLLKGRKQVIKWCVQSYAPLFESKKRSQSGATIGNSMMKRKDFGAGIPNFSSALDQDGDLSKGSSCPDVMKCVLFMVEVDSPVMQDFLYPEGPPQHTDTAWIEEMYRLRQCYKYGADLDDEMLSIVLESSSFDQLENAAGMRPPMALNLIEHLFECCKKDRHAELRLADVSIVWKMYELVKYVPGNSVEQTPKKEEDMNDQFADAEVDEIDVQKPIENGKEDFEESLPGLAYPGLWWRVASLALIMAGASPTDIGSSLAEEHPTIRELIKMVTSGRYRFPTIDCDDSKREEMKKGESEMRLRESQIAELLFLPPKVKPKYVEKVPVSRGSRASARQREREERILRKKREKEIAEALVAENKRKKMLKAAQRSIMIMDPKGPARKPPRESVNLILSVEKLFDLSHTYQKCVEPDLVLQAIGGTSRGAIERAYEWLIPVISSFPNIISRLPPSASCFLLLRVYGREGDRNSELRELSAPLLQHVRKTVTGKFGQDNAVNATNLLLIDVSDRKPARRRCARRVLEETLSELNESIEDKSFDAAKCTWLHSLLRVDHIDVLLSDAISHISTALLYERGQVLRSLILSLNSYISHAEKKSIHGDWKFSTYLCELISTRHNVCSEAIDRFPDVRQLTIKVVYETFMECLQSMEAEAEDAGTVQLKPCRSYKDGTLGSAYLPLSLLQSSCVLLSIWKDKNDTEERRSKDYVNELSNILMFPFDSPEPLLLETEGIEGIASAKMVASGNPAVSVDEWVMLAKSRCDYIARRAALSAPTKFLPRLLLCSGLPKSSLLTMIDRLGKLGEKSQNEHKVYRELLMPSAAASWGFGQLGSRREIARKLLGRLSAYISMADETVEKLSEEYSLTFISWLSEESQPSEKQRKGRPLKKAIKAGFTSEVASRLMEAEKVLEKVDDIVAPMGSDILLPPENVSLVTFKKIPYSTIIDIPQVSRENLKDFIEGCCSRNDSDTIEEWIRKTFFSKPYQARMEQHEELTSNIDQHTVATVLLETSITATDTNSEWNRAVERWTPVLSSTHGNPKLWKIIFSYKEDCDLDTHCIISACCLSWCPFNVARCRDWLLSAINDLTSYDLQGIVNFLLQTSGQQSSHAPYLQQERISASSLFQTKESVGNLVTIAFECAKQAGQVINQRNDVAAWLHLLLLVAQTGKRQANHMISILLSKVEEAKHDGLRMLMGEAILRIYSYYPWNVNLGNPDLRKLLVDSSISIDWREWRSPLDDHLNNMFRGLKQSPNQRLVQGLIDLSKGHPLILLRKLELMTDILNDDAAADTRGSSRSRINAENIGGQIFANYNDSQVKVNVCHWGYRYTDPLWTSFIDILLSVPREVLFPCGISMGLEGLLEMYIKLIWVQSQLRNREQKATRLKLRFSDFMTAFEQDAAWNKWLGSKLRGIGSLGNVRNILIRCSLITTDKAMESIRSQN